jgi:hypothetical protein
MNRNIPMTTKKPKINQVPNSSQQVMGKMCFSASKSTFQQNDNISVGRSDKKTPVLLTINKVIQFLLQQEDLVGGYAEMA